MFVKRMSDFQSISQPCDLTRSHITRSCQCSIINLFFRVILEFRLSKSTFKISSLLDLNSFFTLLFCKRL